MKQDKVPEVLKALRDLTGSQVLVGIPASTTERESEGGSDMTNSELGYIHEFGSPAANIPARPFLIPGVEKSLDRATHQLELAAKAAFKGDATAMDMRLEMAGQIAATGAKREISYGDFIPLKPSTIRNRRRGRRTKSMRAAEQQYLTLVAGGMSEEDAQSAAGIRPLIDTGALRNSITSVVRKRK
ncbi:MAG TPA: hypothetical protein VHY36_13410 [Steroidobacteraceae bacterium]|nr:hypothetical protein [Steroidobacteraceae bacterium]